MATDEFPGVHTGAIRTLASDLQLTTSALADIGYDTISVRDAVIHNEQWAGTASQQWHAAVTERIGDTGLTNDVMGTAASILSQLAADLDAEHRTYDRLNNEVVRRMSQAGGGMFVPPPQVADPDGYKALLASVGRAEDLLKTASSKLLELAALAGDVRAKPDPNRTPGIPPGTNRNAASLQLLAILFGSVRDNQEFGSNYENTVLSQLGIEKNTDVWRPDPAFEGRLTLTGKAKGTIPDGWGSNYILEIKGGRGKQNARFQQRLSAEMAKQEGKPYWMIKRAGTKADPNVLKLTERSGGGVIYRTDSGDFVDGQGNPVTITYDKDTDTLHVSGYKNSAPAGPPADPGAIAPDDPDTPSAPVDPDVADGTDAGGGADPAEPVEPVEPDEPEMPEIPELPFP